jgi:hypothetical protein
MWLVSLGASIFDALELDKQEVNSKERIVSRAGNPVSKGITECVVSRCAVLQRVCVCVCVCVCGLLVLCVFCE